jgi:hypothetical protein
MLRSKTPRVTVVAFHAAFALLCCSSFVAADDSNEGNHADTNHTAWIYRGEVDDLRPVARSISLGEERPPVLAEEIDYRGQSRRYAQLRYGSENSRRVVIVVDEIGDGEFDFYVDWDRDRRITKFDFVQGTGRTRTCDLNTEIIHGLEPEQDKRRVLFRLGATRTRLSVATLGCIQGQVRCGEARAAESSWMSVRRIDGNANGLFADARDRLLIDVNHDGSWDRISEQFAYLPILNLSGRRFGVHSDRIGTTFSLSEITGVGHLRVAVAQLPPSARVIAFEGMVFSVDGSAYSLKQLDDPLSVPVGRYTLGSVTLTIGTEDGDPWHFVFSRSGSIADADWVDVAADQDVTLEAIGQPRFELELNLNESLKPGEAIAVNPKLYTQDGLLINLSCRGRQMGSFDRERFHNRCDIQLVSGSGDTLSSAQSGFA